ncbi:hypothetical protein CBS101457_005078 [Exobasidium rhododendri]|nr:hypothetical protein CBS101457_005078 [Exobasidium rhododendri]
MPGQISKIIGTIKRKPTNALDGMTDDEAAAVKEVKDTSVIHDLLHLKGKDALTLAHALKDLAKGEPMNDRDLLLEHGVSMLQSLPSNSGLSHTISDGFIGMLWKDMPHPPGTTVGPQTRYRTADGSGNVINNPTVGAAGQPYTRTVPPLTPKSPYLPDPELVFDQLLRRRDFKEHKAGLNRMFFSFATIVIHECFQTDHARPWINTTSSYVDLSTLYGNNQAEQDGVRTFQQGRIHPDTIASERIMMMPPGVVACLLLFSRHHNHIAERLLDVNESGKYKPWEGLDEKQQKWQDNDIFQLARNVNVAFFAKVVLTDYVSAILNTVRSNTDWHLELGKEIKGLDGTRLERGTGNQVSCEFNVLYHWHATLSAADEKWMEELIKHDCPGKEIDEVGPMEFMMMVKKHKIALDSVPPSKWTFGGLERGADGRFDNHELGELIKDCIEEPAHAFGARSTPSSMKVIEIMSMLQARNTFNVCTMNEFRNYLNLAPFTSFEEWNSDVEIASSAEKLYSHIDQLELYPGLFAEETKPNIPGSGVQPGHTVGRGILDDAVALVRGDRFLTYDLNSSTLTNWGMSQLAPVPGAYGGFLGHVLSRALPNSWGRGTSSYCLLPFYTPKAVREILTQNKSIEKYDTSRPESAVKLHGLHTYDVCKQAFLDRDTYRTFYDANLQLLTARAGFFIGWDDHTRHDPPSQYMHEAFFEPGFESNVRTYYREWTRKVIAESSLGYDRPKGRRQINVVRDVFNRVPIFWIADRYAIPLKTKATPHGLISPFELHAMLVALFIFSSFDVVPSAGWLLRSAAEEFGPLMRKILETRLGTASGVKERVSDYLAKGTSFEMSAAAHHLYHTIAEKKIPTDKAVASLLGTMLPIAGNITQQSGLLLDLFLKPENEYAKTRLVELAHRDDEEAEREMEMWVWEGMRLSGIVPGLPRVASTDVTVQDGPDRQVHIKAGERLIIGIAKAHLDPAVFPDPQRMDPTRDKKLYILLGIGIHFCFGARLVAPSIVSMLREVFKLNGLRRAKGQSGSFIKVHEDLGHNHDAARVYLYLDNACREGPVPSSLVIEYDE